MPQGLLKTTDMGAHPVEILDAVDLGWHLDTLHLKRLTPQVTVKCGKSFQPEIIELLADEGIVSDVLFNKMVINQGKPPRENTTGT